MLNEVEKTSRGFEIVRFKDANECECSLQQSSAIGAYEDSMSKPGSSFVWLGRDVVRDRMHLDREQVFRLVNHLQHWLKTGSLEQREATHD